MATSINYNQDENFITEICNNNPHLVLRTQCGTGKYVFKKITYRKDKLVLEFRLVKDELYQDSDKISYVIGDLCYLTANQFLFAYNYQAYA
mgnify:CR=1 FL=1